MAAAAAIAKRLKINYSTSGQEAAPNNPLPYSEFRGYMALPLKFPVYLNVGAWLPIIYCLRFALAVWLFVYGFIGGTLIPLLLGSLAEITSLMICFGIYTLMKRELEARTPRLQRLTLRDRVKITVYPHKGKRGTIVNVKESSLGDFGPIVIVELNKTGEQITCHGSEIRVE